MTMIDCDRLVRDHRNRHTSINSLRCLRTQEILHPVTQGQHKSRRVCNKVCCVVQKCARAGVAWHGFGFLLV